MELRPTLLAVAALGVPTLALISSPALALALLAGALPALLVPHRLGRRLGGHSGDSYGACVEWSECGALLLTALAVTLGRAG